MPVSIALFDIDGTLVRAGGAGQRSVELALDEVLDVEEVVSLDSVDFAGRTDPWIITEGLAKYGIDADDAMVADVLRRYVAHLPRQLERAPDFEVLSGAIELLTELGERDDVLLGLGTGNTERAAYAKLARGGLDGFFSFGGFGSDHIDRAELLRIGLGRGRERLVDGREARAVVIGDTPRDVAAARVIGAHCVAVTTGRFGAGELRAAGADSVVESLHAPEVRVALAS